MTSLCMISAPDGCCGFMMSLPAPGRYSASLELCGSILARSIQRTRRALAEPTSPSNNILRQHTAGRSKTTPRERVSPRIISHRHTLKRPRSLPGRHPWGGVGWWGGMGWGGVYVVFRRLVSLGQKQTLHATSMSPVTGHRLHLIIPPANPDLYDGTLRHACGLPDQPFDSEEDKIHAPLRHECTPAGMAEIPGPPTSPGVTVTPTAWEPDDALTFDSIVGNPDAKRALFEHVVLPLKLSEAARSSLFGKVVLASLLTECFHVR